MGAGLLWTAGALLLVWATWVFLAVVGAAVGGLTSSEEDLGQLDFELRCEAHFADPDHFDHSDHWH